MKINSLKILILVCFCYGSVNARNKPVSPAQIPVIGWYGIPAQESTITRYSEMREAGFTMNLSHLSTADEVQTALTAAQKAGMKLIIGRNELHSEPEKTVRRFMNHPALAGYFLRDEPTRNDFQALAEWVKKIQAVDNKHFCYINLLPNYATPEQLGTKTYREYVNTFIKEIPVQILTFDHYPVTGDAQTRVLRPIWYENLEIVADEAQKAGKPFWAFALATSHKPYPIPTIADLRLQVYSNLVYGAQAIQYFTYWTPAAGTWDFHDGPIYNGKKTETYSKVKQVNEEFKGLSEVFLHAKVVSIFHTGATIPQGTKRLEKLPAQIETLETEGKGAIVSFLEKGKAEYVAIVNRDLQNPMTLKVKGNSKMKRVQKNGTLTDDKLSELKTYEVEPGDIIVFRWIKS